jgi:hypothetical protein
MSCLVVRELQLTRGKGTRLKIDDMMFGSLHSYHEIAMLFIEFNMPNWPRCRTRKRADITWVLKGVPSR